MRETEREKEQRKDRRRTGKERGSQGKKKERRAHPSEIKARERAEGMSELA